MSQALTESQRDQLVNLMERRFRKMNDTALLELERLTRHPKDITSYAAQESSKEQTEKVSKTQKTVESILQQPMTRREFLAFSASGLLGLFVLAAGAGWAKSEYDSGQLENAYDELERTEFDAYVENLLQQFSLRIEALDTLVDSTGDTTERCDAMLAAYSETYISTAQRVTQLENSTAQMRGLCNALASSTTLNAPELIQEFISLVNLIPMAEQITHAFYALLEIAQNAPQFVATSEAALSDLSSWFSTDPGGGISNNLFNDMRSLLKTLDEDIETDIASLHDTWGQVTAIIDAKIEQRELIKSEIANAY